MNPPLPGMTASPYGDECMLPAFIGCLRWAAGNEEIVASFMEENPALVIMPARNPIEAMIDEAAGVNAEVGPRFADFVATHIWGTEETRQETD